MPYEHIASKLKNHADTFNLHNNTSFNYGTFIDGMRPANLSGGRGAIDALYGTAFASLATEVLGNAVRDERRNNVSHDISLDMMLDEFENELMQPLRDEGKEIQETSMLNPYGGMSRKEQLEFMIKIVDSVPKSEAEAVEKAYRNGQITIRQMVNFCNDVNTEGSIDTKDLTQMVRYMRALERANESRSFFWKMIHPFRNSAEQREAASIRTRLTANNAFGFETALKNVNREYETVINAREQLQNALDEAIRLENAETDAKRTAVEATEPQKQSVSVRECKNDVAVTDVLVEMGTVSEIADPVSDNDTKSIDPTIKQK